MVIIIGNLDKVGYPVKGPVNVMRILSGTKYCKFIAETGGEGGRGQALTGASFDIGFFTVPVFFTFLLDIRFVDAVGNQGNKVLKKKCCQTYLEVSM